MLAKGPHRTVALECIKLLHMDRLADAANAFADFCHCTIPQKTAKYKETLLNLYYWLLNNGGMQEAAQLLWSPKLFDTRPRCTKDVWQFYNETNTGLIMGAASMSKSYTMGVRLFLEWSRDPHYTTVSVLGPSADHLERNLFSHLVRLHQQASLPIPGTIGELFIGLDRRDQGSSISGVIVPVGRNKKAARLQGAKRFRRKDLHPVFGEMSRMMIFLDEIENIPEGIWSDIDNLMSGVTDDASSIKIFGAYNPTDPSAEVYKQAEPPFGWDDLDPDVHFRWKSVRGWDVLRLDATTCENVKQGRTIFPGLQTKAGIERIAKKAGGLEAPGYLSMVRAMYSKKGAVLAVMSPGIVTRMRGEYIWYDHPTPVGGVDLALEGKASAVFSYGLYGIATGANYPASLDHPQGRKVIFRDERGNPKPKHALQLMQQFDLPKGDTEAMFESVRTAAYKFKIRPEHLCVDRTGNGAGVHDLLRNRWNLAVMGINYTEGATEMKIMAEDLYPPVKEYERICTELWFAMQKWAEFGYLMIHPTVDHHVLAEQLIKRLYKTTGKKTRVESKRDYISRNHPSPDEADSLSLMLHGVRVSFGVILSMTGSSEYDPDPDGDDEMVYRIDETNRFQSLEVL
jgi:hypothetical protein